MKIFKIVLISFISGIVFMQILFKNEFRFPITEEDRIEKEWAWINRPCPDCPGYKFAYKNGSTWIKSPHGAIQSFGWQIYTEDGTQTCEQVAEHYQKLREWEKENH